MLHTVSDVFITPAGVNPSPFHIYRQHSPREPQPLQTTANSLLYPFSCQSLPVSDPDLNPPIPALLRPAQARKPMLLPIAQPSPNHRKLSCSLTSQVLKSRRPLCCTPLLLIVTPEDHPIPPHHPREPGVQRTHWRQRSQVA